jgi:hypothetical protein
MPLKALLALIRAVKGEGLAPTSSPSPPKP